MALSFGSGSSLVGLRTGCAVYPGTSWRDREVIPDRRCKGTMNTTFASGTRILTDRGEVSIEILREGDAIETVTGAFRPVVFLGRRRVDCTRHPTPWDVWPVRVRAAAFAEGVPHRDLLLSPDHGVYIDDVLIPIRHLINGATIVQEAIDEVAYWHVEL